MAERAALADVIGRVLNEEAVSLPEVHALTYELVSSGEGLAVSQILASAIWAWVDAVAARPTEAASAIERLPGRLRMVHTMCNRYFSSYYPKWWSADGSEIEPDDWVSWVTACVAARLHGTPPVIDEGSTLLHIGQHVFQVPHERLLAEWSFYAARVRTGASMKEGSALPTECELTCRSCSFAAAAAIAQFLIKGVADATLLVERPEALTHLMTVALLAHECDFPRLHAAALEELSELLRADWILRVAASRHALDRRAACNCDDEGPAHSAAVQLIEMIASGEIEEPALEGECLSRAVDTIRHMLHHRASRSAMAHGESLADQLIQQPELARLSRPARRQLRAGLAAPPAPPYAPHLPTSSERERAKRPRPPD